MTAPHHLAQTPPTQPMLAPNLARGAMLLIVLAQAPLYLTGVAPGALRHPADGSILDQSIRSTTILAVDSRAYPMFAALLGSGVVAARLLKRAGRSGPGDALLPRMVYWRRKSTTS